MSLWHMLWAVPLIVWAGTLLFAGLDAQWEWAKRKWAEFRPQERKEVP